VTARKVLLASNGYTSRLLPAFADLIVPVRGQVASLLPPSTPPAELTHSYVFLGADGHGGERNEYLIQRPRGDRELVFGGGRQCAAGRGVGVWRDDEVEEDVASYLRAELDTQLDLDPRVNGETETAIADCAELEATFEWTGTMAYSRDRTPWVGQVPEFAGGGEGLFVCAGYTGHGMPAAPLCAREVVRMMLDEEEKEKSGEERLPAQFVVSEERIRRAREDWGEVGEQQAQGIEAEIERLYASMKFERV
jgi:glycine/D-amino acid oxidase-like deaminating enzyme